MMISYRHSPVLLKIVRYQILLTLTGAVVSSCFFSVRNTIFYILGGVLNTITGWIFGQVVLHGNPQKTPRKVLNAFYCGETLKLFVTLMLFACAFQWNGVEGLPLILGFSTAQLAYWLMLKS